MNVLDVVLIFLFSFMGATSLNFHMGRQGTRQAAFERFDNTCGERNLSIIFNLTGMKSEGSKLYMNTTITVKKDVVEEPEMCIRIERCKNKENLDTCEHFYDFKTDKYCELISSPSAVWGPLFGSYRPPLRCPQQKGVYHSVNGELDVAALLLFPLDAWYWRVKVEVYYKAKHTLITCIFVEARINSL